MQRRNHHLFWLDTLALSASVACGVALLLAAFGAGAASIGGNHAFAQSAGGPSAEQTFEGMLTCSRCGAKHSSTLGKNASDCVRVCAHQGAEFTLVRGEKAYPVRGDLDVMKHLAARRVRIEGKLEGNTIEASSVAPSD